MTSITEAQRVALVKAADALWDKASAADTDEKSDYYDEAYYVVNDLLNTAVIYTAEVEDAPTPDAPALWRDSDREDWKREGPIRLELVAAPYVTVGVSRGGSVLIDDDSETVAVEPEHLPALIAMLTEVQRRIGGEAL